VHIKKNKNATTAPSIGSRGSC